LIIKINSVIITTDIHKPKTKDADMAKLASGEWRVASGEWRVASGEWQKMPQIQSLVKHNMPHFTKNLSSCHPAFIAGSCAKTSPLSYPRRRVSCAKSTDLICSQDPRLRGDDKKVWAGMTTPRKAGFTLIELSIVLVIIGLLVGGILVGRDLIKAAEIRAQISQIEKYNTAVRTFQLKYSALPGDIAEPNASAFGFVTRGSYAGQGDSNGMLEGHWGGSSWGTIEGSGENPMFWVDLSTANLISGNYNIARPSTSSGITITKTTTPSILDYFPPSKINTNSYVYTWSNSGKNYFGLSGVTEINGYSNGGAMAVASTIQVFTSSNIDSKIDDGLPQTGSIIAMYPSSGGNIFDMSGATGTAATPASATTCFDNGNVGGAVQKYSVGTNGGNGLNCALSFQFQ
jgi:prepilin-type N-terminal cleavage/methylation domain-containing protein